MLKMITRPKVLLITIVILSALLTISASGSFFYRNAVLGYETQKTLLLNLNHSYTYLLNSMQDNCKKYVIMDDAVAKETFLALAEDYTSTKSIRLNYQAISEFQAYTWISDSFSHEKFNMASLAQHLDFREGELGNYQLFIQSFDKIVSHLSNSVETKNENVFTEPSYINDYTAFNYSMIQMTSAYLNRINDYEDQALKLQNLFGFLSLFLSLALAAVGAFVAYFTVITNRNNSYYRQLFSTTMETADFGLAILSLDYEYKYVNTHYREIMHITENPMGRSPYDLLPPEFSANVAKPTGFDDGLINSTITITSWGVPKHINISRFAIKDEYGQVNFVSVIRDFTELVNMERQLKEQLKEIEFHAKAKDTFLANISHEMKTPLNAIIGLSYVLSDSALSSQQQNVVKRITSSSNLLLNLINDVLDLSKIRNSDFKLYPTSVLLTNLLSEVEGIATALIGDKNVLWQTEYVYSQDLCIKIDKTRLTQVLLNLINNACKFTNEGSIKLHVEATDEDEENVLLTFSIRDTGLGMDEEDLVKLFQEFEQLENYLTKQHQGTGLGLIISKNIIEAMGGTIWVESQKDVGSIFYFTIPAEKTLPEHFKESICGNPSPIFDGMGQRVLVVEDNEINYEVTESLLSKANIQCDSAPDGKTAIKMCEEAPEDYYQLILMDIHMPVMDGFTASKILKTQMHIKTPIIALTATNVDGPTMEAYKGILEDYIPKPFNYIELFSKIEPYFQCNGKLTTDVRKTITESIEDPFSDRVKAIENLGGMEDLYEKHLRRFKANYATVDQQIRQFLEEGNQAEARILAHSVKGLSGTLGLPHLQKISASLEESIVTNSENTDSLLTQFSKKLKDVCAS